MGRWEVRQGTFVCASVFNVAAFVSSSVMLSFVITLSRCWKNSVSYFCSKSVASVELCCTVVNVFGGLYLLGIVFVILTSWCCFSADCNCAALSMLPITSLDCCSKNCSTEVTSKG